MDEITIRVHVGASAKHDHGTDIDCITVYGAPSVPIGPRRRAEIENMAWQRALNSSTTTFSFRAYGALWSAEID